MLTSDQIANAQEFHFGDCTRIVGPRGGIRENVTRYRRASRTKYWARTPGKFQFTVKYGMRPQTYTVEESNVHLFHIPADCPIRAY